MKENDIQRSRRIIFDDELLMAFSGVKFYSGSVKGEFQHYSRKALLNVITQMALLDLTDIMFDSDHYDENNYLNYRLSVLSERRNFPLLPSWGGGPEKAEKIDLYRLRNWYVDDNPVLSYSEFESLVTKLYNYISTIY